MGAGWRARRARGGVVGPTGAGKSTRGEAVETREGERGSVGQGVEELSIGLGFLVVSRAEGVELFDADQGMLVGRITMEIFVLHETGEGTELRQVTAEKIHLVHHAQDTRDLSLAAKDASKDLTRRLAVTKLAIHETEAATEEIGQFRA